MPTNMNTCLWNHLQLLLPSPHHTIFTNHTCPEEGPLAVLCRDLHDQPKGTINTKDLVGASVTVVYVTLPQMRVLHHSRAHHTPFLQLPKWPQFRLFHQYLTQTARATSHTLPVSKDMHAAYRDFKKQRPRLISATPPYAPTSSKHEPVPPVTGAVPPLTLLLAPNEAKPTQTTVIHQGAKWHILKHHMTARDLPKVAHDSQSMPRTCWACYPEAPTMSWPVLHLIAQISYEVCSGARQRALALFNLSCPPCPQPDALKAASGGTIQDKSSITFSCHGLAVTFADSIDHIVTDLALGAELGFHKGHILLRLGFELRINCRSGVHYDGLSSAALGAMLSVSEHFRQ